MPDAAMPGSGQPGTQADAEVRIVLTTCSTQAEAERIAHSLVEARLAACVNIVPAATSIYRWQGRIESSHESLLLIKTSAGLLQSVEESVVRLHSYAVPEFLVLHVSGGSPFYLRWLAAELK